MTTCELVVDSRVKEIIDAAIKAAQPLWVGYTEVGNEVLSRVAVVFEPGDVDECFNAEQVLSTSADRLLLVDGCFLAKSKISTPLIGGLLVTARTLHPGDKLCSTRGSIIVRGPVTREMFT
jgi:hypothetical protein